ncbi:hypothetical protein ACIHCX_03115 [Streptomyces sp. NPDC052043]|uniref:hypothetical protein n=1 Tax=Streptomyces sp. NPDC052043 TaxID=3365684 RepID=UPI0037D7A2AF
MINETTTEYTMLIHGEQRYTIRDAIQAAPGLVIFRLPAEHVTNDPARWRIGHHEGLGIAEAMRREDALKGVQILKDTGIDWTQDTETIQSAISKDTVSDLTTKLSWAWCEAPGSAYMPGDVTSNGTYTDADIQAAADEFKADRLSAYDILLAMTYRVPWMGLDTEPFNEAHDRIVTAAGAE